MSGIYGKYNSYEELYEEVKKLEKEKRFNHTLGVVSVAEELAKLNNYDVSKARLAALLHDCCKNLSDEDKDEFIKKYNIDLSRFGNVDQIKHGPIGAYYLKYVFEIEDEDIFNAVYYHSTGRPDMSTLEKIIYLADFLDPGRDRTGYEENYLKIKDLSYNNLDDGLFMTLERTMYYLKLKWPDNICDDSKNTYEYYKNLRESNN